MKEDDTPHFLSGNYVAIKVTEQTLPLMIYHRSDICYSQSDSSAE